LGVPVDGTRFSITTVQGNLEGTAAAQYTWGSNSIDISATNSSRIRRAKDVAHGKPTKLILDDGKEITRGALSSTDNPLHTIVHEIGHKEHYIHLRATKGKEYAASRYQAWSSGKVSPELGPAASAGMEISRYASSSPMEFVAEVYAKAKLTKWTPKGRVLELYNQLGGAPL